MADHGEITGPTSRAVLKDDKFNNVVNFGGQPEGIDRPIAKPVGPVYLLRQYLAARAAETRKDERLDRLIQQHLGIRSVA